MYWTVRPLSLRLTKPNQTSFTLRVIQYWAVMLDLGLGLEGEVFGLGLDRYVVFGIALGQFFT